MTRANIAIHCVAGLLWALAIAGAIPPAAAEATNGIIVYETDFGLKDGAVWKCGASPSRSIRRSGWKT